MSAFTRNTGLAVLCAAQFVVVLDATVVATALPAVRADLGFSASSLSWVVTAYTVALAGLLISGGRAADLFGARRMFRIGLAVFALASGACALAADPGMLIAARVLQGSGAALLAPAALAALPELIPGPAAQRRALGWWTAAGAGGGASGWLLGGVITQLAGWPWIFAVNIPIGGAALALTFLLPAASPARERGQTGLDVPGAVLATGGIALAVLALNRLSTHGTDLPGWAAAVAAIAVLIGFVRYEGLTDHLGTARRRRSSPARGPRRPARWQPASTLTPTGRSTHPLLLAAELRPPHVASHPTGDPAPPAAPTGDRAEAGAGWARRGRAAHPLLPAAVLRRPGVPGGNFTAAALTGSTTPAMLAVVLYVQDTLRLSPARGALLFPAFNLAVIAGSFAGPRLLTRMPARRVLTLGFTAVIAGIGLLLALPGGGLPVALLLSAFAVMGAGLGTASVASTAAGTVAVPGAERGVAAGLLTSAAQLGTGLGLAVTTPLVASAAPMTGYRLGFATAALVAVAGVAAARLVPRRLPTADTEPNQAEPNQAEPNQAEPNQAEPNQAEPNQAEPNQAEPEHAEAGRTETRQRPAPGRVRGAAAR